MSVLPEPLPPTPEGWEGILEPGEAILWQGAPDGRVTLSLSQLPEVAFGLVFTAFAVFWMFQASRGGGYFWMFGLIFFFVGLGRINKQILGAARRRRYSHYTLTNRRAIVATNLPLVGRALKSYPITATTQLELNELGELGTVNFARQDKVSRNSFQGAQAIGFERIPDARQVFSLMRQIQQEAK